MATAADIIKEALHLFGILDQTEDPTPTDIANNVATLNNLLRAENADGACQYLINTISVQLAPGTIGTPYSFFVGTASPSYAVQVDAVAVRAIYINDIGNVNRETRIAKKADVLRTTYPGIFTKWHPERQSDGSVKVTAWQPPRAVTSALIEYGGRLPAITAVDGSDVIRLPPEGIHDATLLLGRKIFGSYGKNPADIAVILQDSERVNARWRDWARGQQWIQIVRS